MPRPERTAWAILPAALCLLIGAGPAVAAASACPKEGANFPSLYADRGLFDAAIMQAEAYPASPTRLSGMAVPHHLLVPHLIATGFQAASGVRPKRVVILSPDHFRRLGKPFGVAMHGFETPLGAVPADLEAAQSLLRALPRQAEPNCLFASEHGVQALMPFVRHHFPSVPVLAVAVALRSDRADWAAMVEALAALADEGTLIVQSTDFSHFLPATAARAHDQQVLNLIAAGSPDALAGLNQPAHVDSLGAFVIQSALQSRRGAEAVVVVNENSQAYGSGLIGETTSYMVVLWGERGRAAPLAPGADRAFLAGDTFFGRSMPQALGDELAADRVAKAVLAVTDGAPLVVNLEGVILPELPASLPHLTLAMPTDFAIPWLKRLNVVGVSLANNHATDLGADGLKETRAALEAAGIPAAGPGEVLSLDGLDIVALTDLDTNASPQTDLLTPAQLDALLREGPARAVAAFVHWGREWNTEPAAREEWLMAEMARRGVSTVAGAHPHRASTALLVRAGGDLAAAFSLGNFLFDQTAERGASGALLELTVFAQGTAFARLRPVPNLFDLAQAR